MPGASRITAAEYLKTLDLYLELGTVKQVADRLGLSVNTAWNRLIRLGRMAAPEGSGGSIDVLTYPAKVKTIREDLERGILPRNAKERNRAPRVKANDQTYAIRQTSAAELLQTLELYLDLQSTQQVAAALGISNKRIRRRLHELDVLVPQPGLKPKGFVRQENGEARITSLLHQLHWQAAIESLTSGIDQPEQE